MSHADLKPEDRLYAVRLFALEHGGYIVTNTNQAGLTSEYHPVCYYAAFSTKHEALAWLGRNLKSEPEAAKPSYDEILNSIRRRRDPAADVAPL